MLTGLALALTLQQAAGGAVIWESPAPLPSQAEVLAPDASAKPALPDWALADPFGWERSQCSPLIRETESLEACQVRVRADLAIALGDDLPAALRPSGDAVPCAPAQDDDGAYPVQCGVPERRLAAAPSPRIQDCRSRPVRSGGAVAFTTDCREDDDGDDGLSFTLSGDD